MTGGGAARAGARGRSALAAAALAAALLGAWVSCALLGAVRPLGRLPLWDGAGNGWGAVELLAALEDGRLLDFLLRLNAQDKWPFGWSLLALPFVAAGGASFASAAWLPALAFALVPALLFWLAREAEPERLGDALAAGALAALLWLASPLPRALATVAMRETTGAALAVAVAAAYLRARRLGTLAAWRLAGVLLLAQFSVKYNYFLLSALPLALHALLELGREERRALLGRARAAVLERGWRSPARWAALVALASVVSLALGRNPGVLIYGALVAGLAVGLSRSRESLRLSLARCAALDPAPRAALETLAVPLWLWSLSPDPIHPRNVLAFLRSRPGELPPGALEFWVAPLRSFADEFAPEPRLGLGVALAALAGALVPRARRGPRRAVALAALAGTALVVLHPMKEPRFLVTLAPFAFLAAGLAGAGLAAALRPAALARAAAAALALGAAGAALVVPVHGALGERLLADHRRLTGDPALAAPLDALVRRLGAGPRAAFVGATNELSEALVRWRGFSRSGRDLGLPPAPRGIDAADPPEERRRRFEAWLARARPEAIVALEPLPGSRFAADRDYLRYNRWQVEELGRLRVERRWRPGRPERFRALGLRIATWRPAGRAARER